MKNKSNILVYLKLFLTALFWGGTFIAGRILAKDMGPFSAAFLRFAVASSFLLIITWKVEGRLPMLSARQFINIFFLGMSGVFLYNVFFFKGLSIVTAGRAALIIANNPVFIALLTALIFKERLTVLKLAGVLISVTGAVIVISKGEIAEIISGGVGTGEILILCCVASWVFYSLLGKVVMKEFSPLVTVSYASAFGGAALFLPACYDGLLEDFMSFSLKDWSCIVYLGFFGTVVGFVWYYEGIKTIGPMKASQFINFVPISAIVLAFIILGEPITHSLLLGAVFVTTGVYLTNRPTGFRE